jgi:GNAT superfamily N-acetyltransferase
MQVRHLAAGDGADVERIARRSFEASYALSPTDIDVLLDERFDAGGVGGRVESSRRRLFVAETDGPPDDRALSGFAELDADGTLRWVHVHPHDRGRGVGTALVERTRRAARAGDARFGARTLASAREGEAFLQRFGLERTGTATISVGAKRFEERVFGPDGDGSDANEPAVAVPETVVVDGQERPIDGDLAVPGSRAPFHPALDGDDGDRRVGFLCTQCGGTTVAADGLGRLRCLDCGNEHASEDWDGAYL